MGGIRVSVNRIICHVDPATVPDPGPLTDIHVLLYGSTPVRPGTAIAGGQLPDLASRFGLVIRDRAFDFMSVALAVTAADTFVKRESAEDAWARTFEVVLPLADMAPWERVRSHLEAALHFLSGDVWAFKFTSGGRRAPAADEVKRRTRVVPLDQVDCACLFSGGLDSAVGALRLIGDHRRPLLVSHVYRGDKSYQEDVASLLPRPVPAIHANFYPTWDGPDDEVLLQACPPGPGCGKLSPSERRVGDERRPVRRIQRAALHGRGRPVGAPVVSRVPRQLSRPLLDAVRSRRGGRPHHNLPLGAGLRRVAGEAAPAPSAAQQRIMAGGRDLYQGQGRLDLSLSGCGQPGPDDRLPALAATGRCLS
jgi:hypothetical protein